MHTRSALLEQRARRAKVAALDGFGDGEGDGLQLFARAVAT
jgi:hypothetical protein